MTVAVLCFILRLNNGCGVRHLLVSVVPLIIAAAAVLNCTFDVSFDDAELYVSLTVFAATVFLPGAISMLAGGWVASRWKSGAARSIAIVAAVAIVFCAPGVRWLAWEVAVWYASYRANVIGRPDLCVNARELKHTVVVPTLDSPVTPGTNVIWCATFQIAWNELCGVVGEDIETEPRSSVAQALNKKAVSKTDLDEATYVALAGTVGDGVMNAIPKKAKERFEQGAMLTPGALSKDWLVAYACLSANLPFEWAFERLYYLEIGGVKVKSFGIAQYVQRQENERRAASQVMIYDGRSEDDFILELKTRMTNHHLILAKVPPSGTLEQTVRSVQRRIAETKPKALEECQSLMVPLFNFDIICDYQELTGKQLTVNNGRFRGQQLAVAEQQVRFRLDERGALLKSEALIYAGFDMNLVFDKPFLIILRYGDSEMPYFALWADNPEVLVKY